MAAPWNENGRTDWDERRRHEDDERRYRMREERWQDEGRDREYGLGSWSGRGGMGTGMQRDRGGYRGWRDEENERGMYGRRTERDYGRDLDRGGYGFQGYGRDMERWFGRDSDRDYGRDFERGYGGRYGGDYGYGTQGYQGYQGYQGIQGNQGYGAMGRHGGMERGTREWGARYGQWGTHGMGGYRPGGFGGEEYGFRGGERGWGQEPHGRYMERGLGGTAGGWRPEHLGYGAEPYGPWGEVGEHTGKGPRNYQRNWERIRENVCEALERNGHVDATDIEVKMENGEVTLTGTVKDRHQKRIAEQIAEGVYGVEDVHNQLRVQRDENLLRDQSQMRGTTGATMGKERGNKQQPQP